MGYEPCYSSAWNFATPMSNNYYTSLPPYANDNRNTFSDLGTDFFNSSIPSDNAWHNLWTNGDYAIQLKRSSSSNDLRLLEISTNIYVNFISGANEYTNHMYVSIGYDTNTDTYAIYYLKGQYYSGTQSYSGTGNGTFTMDKTPMITRFLENTPLITYQWTSITAISGANGITALAQVKDEAIDGSATKLAQPESNIERYTSQSNILSLVQNLVMDEWVTIAYSGMNYAQAKWTEWSAGGAGSRKYSLRLVNHYGEGNNQYYSVVYTVDVPDHFKMDGTIESYLTFIIDREAEAAQFYPITRYLGQGVNQYYLSPSETEMGLIYYWLTGSDDEPQDEEDPYATGSEGDGGDGNPYQPQDHIGLSSKPTESGLDLGIVTLYKPSKTQLQAIASFMWSDDVLDNFKKYFNNFGDNLLSLMIIPYEPEAEAVSAKKFKVGNMESDDVNLQSVVYVKDRYADIDMGSFFLKRKWDSYLDVSPYSKLEIYLPYCGTHQLNTDEIVYPANMDGFLPVKPEQDIELKLNYRLDLVTGNIVASLFVNGENRYQFVGKCGITVPITGANYNNMVTGAITAGAGLAATIASGGLTAPLSAAAAVSGTVMASKPEIYRSGNLSGDVSMLGYDTPYLIKTIPNKPTLEKQELYTGFPSYKKGTLGSFSGYTEVIEAHIDDVACTSEERDMIMAALKGGVII